MRIKLMKLKCADGTEVEYVRIFKQAARGVDGSSVLLSRFSQEQQAAIRAGNSI